MGLASRIAETMISRMSREDKQRLVEGITDRFISNMTAEEKQALIGRVMEKFFAGMTTDEKKKLMSGVTPHLMEGFDMTVIMPQMLMGLMGMGQAQGASAMPIMTNITGKAKEADGDDKKEGNEP